MKTPEELDHFLLTLYWHVEHGEHKKAIEKLDKLQKDGIEIGIKKAADKVNYWRGCHEGRLKIFPDNFYTKCEIQDCKELEQAILRLI